MIKIGHEPQTKVPLNTSSARNLGDFLEEWVSPHKGEGALVGEGAFVDAENRDGPHCLSLCGDVISGLEWSLSYPGWCRSPQMLFAGPRITTHVPSACKLLPCVGL